MRMLKAGKGFTLVELLIVLLIVALLASIVTPVVSNSVQRAKEAVLKENLFTLRKAIDDYYADAGVYPDQLTLLVDKRYIRRMPLDPIADSHDSWIEVRDDADAESNGIIDVYSGAQGVSIDGESYRDW